MRTGGDAASIEIGQQLKCKQIGERTVRVPSEAQRGIRVLCMCLRAGLNFSIHRLRFVRRVFVREREGESPEENFNESH